MALLALRMEVGGAHAEALADALIELGADSVSAEDAASGTADEGLQFGEPGLAEPAFWPRSRLTALVSATADAAAMIERAASVAGLSAAPSYSVTGLEEDDWVRRTQAQFEPTRIGRLWIGPRWCEPPHDPSVLVMRLDPGLAFGTGSHPSTRLVLRWLEATLRGGERLLDYGCGSGILAIAASKLGAAEVTAVDLDPQALGAAAGNARANAAAVRVQEPGSLGSEPFDVIVANILAGPLIQLAPEFARLARRGARVALAGVLTAQAEEVIAACTPAIALRASAAEEGWQLLSGARR